MVGIDFQHFFRRHGHGRSVFHGFEHFFHFQRNFSVRRKANRVVLHSLRQPYLFDGAVKRVFNKIAKRLVFLFFRLDFFFFGVAFKSQILGAHRTELFLFVTHKRFNDKFVHVVGHVKNLVTLILKNFGLGQLGNLFDAVAASVINVFLVLFHSADVFFKRNKLVLGGGMEQNKVFKLLFL